MSSRAFGSNVTIRSWNDGLCADKYIDVYFFCVFTFLPKLVKVRFVIAALELQIHIVVYQLF